MIQAINKKIIKRNRLSEEKLFKVVIRNNLIVFIDVWYNECTNCVYYETEEAILAFLIKIKYYGNMLWHFVINLK